MIKFCSECGASTEYITPQGDHLPRAVCTRCNHIHYENPRVINCALIIRDGEIMICKRGIEPKLGLWTIPGGFMENGETLRQGAIRESKEEALVDIQCHQLIATVSLPDFNQVHMFFLASMLNDHFGVTDESTEVKFVPLADIPWDDIAFRTVFTALKHYVVHHQQGEIPLLETAVYANQLKITPEHPLTTQEL